MGQLLLFLDKFIYFNICRCLVIWSSPSACCFGKDLISTFVPGLMFTKLDLKCSGEAWFILKSAIMILEAIITAPQLLIPHLNRYPPFFRSVKLFDRLILSLNHPDIVFFLMTKDWFGTGTLDSWRTNNWSFTFIPTICLYLVNTGGLWSQV